MFYANSGASGHLIPSRDNLHAYQKFAKPVEIPAANGGKIYAYGSGTLCVATLPNSLGREADIQDVYYALEAHARLVSLEGQEWDVRLCDDTMELRDRDGDLFAKIAKANNVYPVRFNVIPPTARFAAWTTEGEGPTHEELVERLGKIATVARAKGGDGMRATLMTWPRRLGHPSFKAVIALSENGADCMVITDLFPVLMHALHVLQRNRYTSRTRRAISCRSVPGSSPHRHSGANAHEIGWWKGT